MVYTTEKKADAVYASLAAFAKQQQFSNTDGRYILILAPLEKDGEPQYFSSKNPTNGEECEPGELEQRVKNIFSTIIIWKRPPGILYDRLDDKVHDELPGQNE